MGKTDAIFVLVSVACAAISGCGGASEGPQDRNTDRPVRARPVQIAAPRPGPPPAPSVAPPPVAPEPAPELTDADRLAILEEIYNGPRHFPELIKEPPQKSRIAPGAYRCRVGKGYKLRGCRVEKDPTGHVLLEVEPGNLIGMRGVLQDDGPAVRFEGWLTERRPFGCFGCQERCFVHPGSCFCVPLVLEASRECMLQPLVIRFKGGGGSWKGKLDYKTYYNHYDHGTDPPTPVGFDVEQESFEVLLRRK